MGLRYGLLLSEAGEAGYVTASLNQIFSFLKLKSIFRKIQKTTIIIEVSSFKLSFFC